LPGLADPGASNVPRANTTPTSGQAAARAVASVPATAAAAAVIATINGNDTRNNNRERDGVLAVMLVIGISFRRCGGFVRNYH
jgi:hypothetical protein